MKKTITTGLFILMFGVLLGPVIAEEGFSDEGFEDDFSSGFGTDADSGSSDGFSFFDDSAEASDGSAEAPTLSWSGEAKLDVRNSIDYENFVGKADLQATPELTLDLEYLDSNSEFRGSLQVSRELNYENITDIDSYLRKIINEAYITLFFPGFDLQAGFMKIVWGKGDKVHVLDTINPTDYSDFINPDYLDRKIAEKMLKANIPYGDQGLVEFVWVPTFTADTIPREGTWVQKNVQTLTDTVTNYLASYVASRTSALAPSLGGDVTAAKTLALAEAATIQANALQFEKTNTLENGVYALRWTDSFSGVDLGASYQYTYHRIPAVDSTKFQSEQKIYVSNDRLHLIGLEGASVLGPVNLRGEAAWFITEDIDGDSAVKPNNRLEYLGGFDVNLPVNNMNFNVQCRGAWVLMSDKIKSGDMEYNDENEYSQHIISAALTDTYLNEAVDLRLAGAFEVEDLDYMLTPKISFNLIDDAHLDLGYTFFYGDSDTLFGQFRDNDFLEILFRYKF